MPREIITEFQTDAGSGFLAVMFFDFADPVADQRASLSTFWGAVDASLNNGISWRVQTGGRELANTTGVLTGVWSDATAYTGTGAGTVDPVPDASQVLFQWHTSAIINGRILKGRTFVPGLEISAITNGNVDPAFIPNFETYGNTLISDAVGFGVWHRPVLAAGGSFEPAVTCTVWSELAVLRRRRH